MRQKCTRWLTTVVVLLVHFTASSQQLKKIEYFFDADPGVGNGTVIQLSPTQMVDSTFSFDVSSLSDGLHLLFVRAQDEAKNWSLSFVASFVKLTGSDGVPSVRRIEYFFDNDPGIGNGTLFSLASASAIDSTVSLTVSALQDGLHMLYLRTQEASGEWSQTYTASFVKTTGEDTAAITRLEYFVDDDPGFGSGIDLPVQPGNVVSDTFDIQVPDNGSDLRYLAIRARDQKGQWSLLFTDSVEMCTLYKTKPNFTWIRYGNQYSFIDSTKNNLGHKTLWRFSDLGVDSVSNPQFEFPQGNHSVTLVTGEGCRKDSITLPLFVGLEEYYPDTALVGGNVIMSFYGGGMDTTVTVTLRNSGGTIVPYGRGAYQLKLLQTVFDLHTATPGVYDVELRFPNGYDTVIRNGIRIINPVGGATAYNPDLSVQVIGPTSARGGSQVKLQMVVTNNGGMMAQTVPVWLTLGQNGSGTFSNYDLNVNYTPPPAVQFNYVDSVPTFAGFDSLLGQPWNGRVNGMIIPSLNAGESYVHTFYVTAPLNHGEYIDIYAWVGQRMHGSPFRSVWGNCFDVLFDFAVGFVPVAGCVNSAFNYFVYDLPSFYNGSSSVGGFMWNTAGALISCVPGGTIASKLGHADEIVNGVNHVFRAAGNLHGTANGVYGGNTCDDANDQNNLLVKRTKHTVSVDPNDISGPSGYALPNYINGNRKIGYRIGFENLPTATASAQRVYIADTLDKTKFDLSTFELAAFGFGDTLITIPPQRKEFTQTVDLRPQQDLLLRLNVKLDTATGILRYAFLSLDPATRDTLPLSDLRGFLPPDIDDNSGRGSVSYLVSLNKGLMTGDEVKNKASIVFDNNAPIITNTWLNTIDKAAPTGSIRGGTKLNDTTVRLSLTGTDIGAGIHRYKLYVSENGKPFDFNGLVVGDTARFIGSLDSSYRLYAVPVDSVNNLAPKAPAAEYSITFTRPLPVTLLTFSAQKQQSDVLLTWKVASEEKFSHYEVERSPDGNRFEKIGRVAAQAGTDVKSYTFTDANALVKHNDKRELYYRLKMVDRDNTSKYSRIAKISLDKKYTVNLYPNPARAELFIDGIEHYHTVQIADANGKIILSQRVVRGVYSVNIAGLKAGGYILTLLGNDDVQSLKFVKL